MGLYGIGVFQSQDRGDTWSEVGAGLPAGSSAYWLETLGSDLYAGTWGEGVFRWDDGNRAWKPANTGLANRFVRSAVVAGSTLYVGTSGGVFRSALK